MHWKLNRRQVLCLVRALRRTGIWNRAVRLPAALGPAGRLRQPCSECSRSNSEARGRQPTLTPQRHSFQACLTQFPKAPRPQVGVSFAHSGNLATGHTWQPPSLPSPAAS